MFSDGIRMNVLVWGIAAVYAVFTD